MLRNRGLHSVVGQLYFKNKFIRKEIRFVITRGWWGGEEKLDEGNKKVQVSSYMINKCLIK